MPAIPPNPVRVGLLLVLSACGVAEGGDRADAILALDGDALAGADVYDIECSACHGLNGEGGSAPTMAAAVEGHDKASLIAVLLEGEGSMPSFEDLSDQDLADVAAYLDETW